MRVSQEMLARWRKYADLICRDHNITTADVSTGAQAWTVAFKLDIPREAYHVGLNDSHIETALRRIFPKAVFTGK